MMGVELNIMDYDGTVDLEQSVLEPLDYAIAACTSLYPQRHGASEYQRLPGGA